MKEKEKEQEKAMRTPRNTFIVNLGYGWITSRVEMRSGTYKWSILDFLYLLLYVWKNACIF